MLQSSAPALRRPGPDPLWLRRSRLVAAALGLLTVAACDDATAPAGVPADVSITVAVDRDASGTLTPADSGIADVALALVALDGVGATRSATTDSNGEAEFADVPPGAYRVELPATEPATGVVLTTSPEPRVVVSATGGVSATPVLYGWQPATISGRIFRDDDDNGVFDETDTPGAGLRVRLSVGAGAGASTPVDSTVTENDGRFEFRFRAPGSYVVELENPGTITYPEGGNTRVVALAAGEVAEVSGIFTGALVIPIAEARQRTSGVVAVLGNLTVRPGQMPSGSNSELWVQDATGGIAAFSVPTADSLTYALGDVVEISGNRSAFNGQAQISVANIRRVGPGTVPAAVTQSAAQANALVREGQLVRVPNLTVISIGGGTGPAFNVSAVDAADDTLVIRVPGAITGLSRATFTLGSRYDITGILTQFRGTAQLKLRAPDDVELGAAITPIADVRAAPNGEVFTVAGRVSAAPGSFTSGSGGVNSELWVQDASGGIAVFSVPTADSLTYALGTAVEVTGTTGAFGGQKQLASSPIVVRTGAGGLVTPVVQTGTEVNARTLEGRVVRLDAFTVTSIGGGTSVAFTVVGTAGDGQTVQVRVGGALRGISRASFTVGNTYRVTGILTQFNGTAQIKPRTIADIVTP